MLKDEAGGDLSDFITNGEWYLIGKFSLKNALYCMFDNDIDAAHTDCLEVITKC